MYGQVSPTQKENKTKTNLGTSNIIKPSTRYSPHDFHLQIDTTSLEHWKQFAPQSICNILGRVDDRTCIHGAFAQRQHTIHIFVGVADPQVVYTGGRPHPCLCKRR